MEELISLTQSTNAKSRFSRAPNFIAPGVMDIDYRVLRAQGIRHLIFDIDNTIISFGEHRISAEMRDFIIGLQEANQFTSIRLATNSPRRLKWLKDELGLHITQPRLWRFKPLPSFYNHLLEAIGDTPKSVIMIGDKLVQDIWGANKIGLKSILVQPLGRDNIVDQVLCFRWQERRLLRKYLPRHVEKWF